MRDGTASSMEAYCAWYEFALFAMNMNVSQLGTMGFTNSEIRSAMEKAKRFYAPWHLDKRLSPDKWWKSHSHLFEETRRVRLLKVGEKPRVPDALIIEVPLTLSPTRLKNDVGKLITQEMQKRGRREYIDISRPSAAYKLSAGKKLRISALEDIKVYISTYLVNSELRGRPLLKKMRDAYDKRWKRTGQNVPSPYIIKDEGDENRIRVMVSSMNRHRWKSHMLLKNVLNGDFPGNHY
jgi:hypothetical protein